MPVLLAVLLVVLGVAWTIVVAALVLPRTPADQDEVWFLLVAQRVARGRRLYAEVFYGAGPIPVWSVATIVRRGGGLRRLRLLGSVVTAVTSGLLLTIVALAGGSPLLVGLLAVALAGPVPAWRSENLYSGLARAAATLAVTAVLAAEVAALPGGATPWWVAGVAGTALVVAGFSKHPVGAVTSLVVLPATAVLLGAAAAIAMLLATVVGSAVVLVVLARRRELRGFVRRTLTDKGTYLATGRLSFLGCLRALVSDRPPRWRADASAYVLVALAPAAALGAVAARTGAAWAVVALALLAVVGVIPRADPEHVRPSAPAALVAVVLALTPLPLAGEVLAAAVAAGGLVTLVASVRRPPVAPEVSVDALDGLATVSPVTAAGLDAGRRIRAMAGRRVLVLRNDPAQWYLALGLRNPTAYDYPLASTFGRRGQEEVAARLHRGDVEWCLFMPTNAGPLSPTALEDAVRSRMEPVLSTVIGDLCRARPETGGATSDRVTTVLE